MKMEAESEKEAESVSAGLSVSSTACIGTAKREHRGSVLILISILPIINVPLLGLILISKDQYSH